MLFAFVSLRIFNHQLFNFFTQFNLLYEYFNNFENVFLLNYRYKIFFTIQINKHAYTLSSKLTEILTNKKYFIINY